MKNLIDFIKLYFAVYIACIAAVLIFETVLCAIPVLVLLCGVFIDGFIVFQWAFEIYTMAISKMFMVVYIDFLWIPLVLCFIEFFIIPKRNRLTRQ